MILCEILVPLLNANEPEARVVGIHVAEGQAVKKGALLFTLETTKAATDIESPDDGFIRIFVSKDQSLTVGDKLACLTSTASESVEIQSQPVPPGEGAGPRMTKPARVLLESLGLDPAVLPVNRLITEDIVREYAALSTPVALDLPVSGKPSVLLFGGGGHTKALIDLLAGLDLYAIAGILDDRLPAGTRVLGVPVLGSRALLPAVLAKGVRLAVNGVGGILDINIRVRIFELLTSAGYSFPALIHGRATLENSAVVEDGVQVFGNAYIGSSATLHEKCMVNTGAVISHDCSIGAYTHIAPGALLAGHVHVGERSLIGMGVTTAVGVQIGSGVRVGNAATILADIPDRTIVQAGRFWTGKADTPR